MLNFLNSVANFSYYLKFSNSKSVVLVRSVQSDNGATKALRVEAIRYVISRMLLHSYISPSLFFSQSRKMRRMRRDAIHMRERITANRGRADAVECNLGKSQTNSAFSPPPLIFFVTSKSPVGHISCHTDNAKTAADLKLPINPYPKKP